MTDQKTTPHSAEFKRKILSEIQETKNVALVARTHNLNYQTVSGWVRASRTLPDRTAAKQTKSERKLIEKLQLENRALKELLKKTNQTWLTDVA